MSIIDTHAHLYDQEIYNNINEIVKELKKNNISNVLLPGTTLEDDILIRKTVNCNEKMFYPMIGIHPENVDKTSLDKLSIIEEKLSNYKYIGIGEIGLDYHYNIDNANEQKKFLSNILDIAIKFNLPVSIHCRDAFQDMYNILKLKSKLGLRGVIHCFTGDINEASKYIDIGFYLGIGGIVTFKNSKLKDTLKQIGLNNIVLETDSPYLSPEPVRGTINTPCNLVYVVEYLSIIYNMSKKDIENEINSNVEKIFKLTLTKHFIS